MQHAEIGVFEARCVWVDALERFRPVCPCQIHLGLSALIRVRENG